MRRTGQLIALDRHPLVVYLLALCVLSGVANLVSPSPTAPHVPVWVNRAWYLLLVAGGLTALTGAFWRDVLTGVLVVRAGLLAVGAGAYAYALAIGHSGHALDVFGAVIVAGFGVAAHWRVAQATLHVRAEWRQRAANASAARQMAADAAAREMFRAMSDGMPDGTAPGALPTDDAP